MQRRRDWGHRCANYPGNITNANYHNSDYAFSYGFFDCVPSVELRRRLCLKSIPALLVQRRLRWFGRATRRPEGELIKDLLLPTPPRTWRRRAGGQLKTWATTIKTDLEPISGPRVFGHARWRKDWVKVSSELAQDRRAWSASVRGVVIAIGDAGSCVTRVPAIPG